MFHSRKELYENARQMYRALLNRTAKRYFENEQYVISDVVGYECTRLEELLRPLWGIAPFLSDPELCVTYGTQSFTVPEFINRILLDGTDPSSEKRFDRNVTDYSHVTFANQAVTEIAAYLITVKLQKEALWDILSEKEQQQIGGWIRTWAIAAIRDSWPNNHYFYPIFCLEILSQLGFDCSEVDEEVRRGYEFLEKLYYGNGWYSDGELGRFDYYEAWAHHTYTLLWILVADPEKPGYEEKSQKYRERTTEFLRFFAHYFDEDGGIPAYGRSLSYRFGAVAPFGMAALTGCDIDFGLAKSIILRNIGYFFEKSIPTDDGVLPVGYLYSAPGFGEKYQSDGAATCYTEGLLCLLADESHPLWTAKEQRLPIENGDYLIHCPQNELSFSVVGDRTNGITIFNNSLHYYQDGVFGHRFNDMAGCYSKFAYNSRAGFALSTADDVACDNMISLITPDGQMMSQRKRILDIHERNGVFHSTHIPFSNDRETKIETALIPLRNGWHVRVHRVTLSQPYSVTEGGFSVGITDDGFQTDGAAVAYRNVRSQIILRSNVPAKYAVKRLHPGMHLLCPQAVCPVWKTDVLLKGTYLFVSAVCFRTDGVTEDAPEVIRHGSSVTVNQGEIHRIIKFQ